MDNLHKDYALIGSLAERPGGLLELEYPSQSGSH
jgi:hypothetical protein